MKAQINKDQRFDAAKLSLISDIKKAAGYKDDRNELQRFVASLNEEIFILTSGVLIVLSNQKWFFHWVVVTFIPSGILLITVKKIQKRD